MFEGEDTITLIFWFCAIVGTVFFLLKGVLTLVAGADFDLDPDAVDLDSIDGHDTEVAFKVLSLTSISAFVMMFGWGGLAAYKEYLLSSGPAVVVAMILGFVGLLATAYTFKLALKLKSDGETFEITQTVGQIAKVYQEISASGTGKIQITVNGLMRELEATSSEGVKIKSFESVEVVEVLNDQTVAVKLISNNIEGDN